MARQINNRCVFLRHHVGNTEFKLVVMKRGKRKRNALKENAVKSASGMVPAPAKRKSLTSGKSRKMTDCKSVETSSSRLTSVAKKSYGSAHNCLAWNNYVTSGGEPENELQPFRPADGSPICTVFDDVLQEILEELKATGRVFSSRGQYLLKRPCEDEKKGGEESKENFDFLLANARLQSLFEKMSRKLETINKEADRKEAFLAGCGLVRSGVVEVLRERRLEKAKTTIAENLRQMRQLRPNPRRTQIFGASKPSFQTSECPPGTARNERIGVRDRVVRVAAKKLTQAKSHASVILKAMSSRRGVKRCQEGMSLRSAGLNFSDDQDVLKRGACEMTPKDEVKSEVNIGDRHGAQVLSERNDDFRIRNQMKETGQASRGDGAGEEEQIVGHRSRRTRSMALERKRRKDARSRSNSPNLLGSHYVGSVTSDKREDVCGFLHHDDKCSEVYPVRTQFHGEIVKKRPTGILKKYRGGRNRRLTLLERVVLGLSCRVTQFEGNIFIKRLHPNDLVMLLQRVRDTGFTVAGISGTRKNENSDQEFEVIISCRMDAEKENKNERWMDEKKDSNSSARTRGTIGSAEKSLRKEVERAPVRSETMHVGSLAEEGEVEGSGGRNKTEEFRGVPTQQRIGMQLVNSTGPEGMFRRRNPKKVIPKVFTGTPTIPKIIKRSVRKSSPRPPPRQHQQLPEPQFLLLSIQEPPTIQICAQPRSVPEATSFEVVVSVPNVFYVIAIPL